MNYFDEHGNLIQEIPQECVESCSHVGQCDDNVEYWQNKLNFDTPREQAIDYLQEFGAWTKEELNALSDDEISQKVLWIACSDIKENGEFIGIIH
jgi:hypothetical protein